MAPRSTRPVEKEIYEACKGWGTDNKRLIKAIGTKTPTERTKISLRYKEIYDKDLKTLMKKECSGDYGTALQLLALPCDVAEAKLIKMATAGLGTSERILYPIVCGRSNSEMEILKKTYFKTYDRDLSTLIKSELRGNLADIHFTCVQGAEEQYDPHYHTEEKSREDAEAIYEAGQGRLGTDEKSIFKILCFSPPHYLEAVNAKYAEKYGYTLFKAFEKEFSGDVEKAALFTLGMKLKPYETVALLIKSSCAGIGTDELPLTACIVRYQHIMKRVMLAHIYMFGKSVKDRVKSETSGNYKTLLLEVLETMWPDMA